MNGRITTFRRDRMVFRAVDAGSLDAEPVVLLHGFPQTSSSWRRVTPTLNAHGLRTIAPDQRGYSPGASPRGRRAYRMGELVGDVIALIDRIDAPVHLVGHDWGAAVAWSTAAAHPDRIRTLTSVSVPHTLAFLKAMLTSAQALRWSYAAAIQLPVLPELLFTRPAIARALLTRSGLRDADADRIIGEVLDTGALPYGLNWYRGLPFPAPPAVFRGVVVPTTHVWGVHDPFVTRRSAEYAGAYVDAPYRLVIADGDHWLPENEPELVARAILDRVGDAG